MKVERYVIEEYDEPREIEKVLLDGKFRKKYIVEWMWKREWWLDPCEIKEDRELEEEVERWKKDTRGLYEYVLEKYGQEEANGLLDLLAIVRSDCYEWEIRIE